MRVALVTTGLGFGGAERIVEALAEDIAHRGCPVVVIATTRGGPIADALMNRNIPVEVLGLRHAFDARIPLALRGRLKRHRVELVHSHLAVADIAVALALGGHPGLARVSTVHNPGVELSPGKRIAWHRALRHFHRVLAVSEHVRDHLPSQVESTVLHPSLVTQLSDASERLEARATLGLGPEERVVMGVGRLARIKGFDLLAQAHALVRTPGLRFLLVGDGPERPALEEGGVELLGERADAARLIAAADVVVCPSRSEGFPQVPLHAAAAGVPVVATSVGGQSEVVLDEETGLLVGPDNPASLARAIDRLFGDPSLRARLGQGARARLGERGLFRANMLGRTLEAFREARRLAATGKVLETARGSR